jgi:Cyclic nucleotide-binding domain
MAMAAEEEGRMISELRGSSHKIVMLSLQRNPVHHCRRRNMEDKAIVDFGILAGAGAPTLSFKAGEIIFREGDPAEELFVVKSGKIEIRLGNRLLDTRFSSGRNGNAFASHTPETFLWLI